MYGGVPRWLDVLSAGVKLDRYHPGVSACAHLLTLIIFPTLAPPATRPPALRHARLSSAVDCIREYF